MQEKESQGGPTIGGRWLSADELLGRIGFLAISAYAFHTGLKLYSAAGIWSLAVPLSLLLYSLAVLALGGVFLVSDALGRRAQTFLGVILLVALGSGIAYEISYANPGYGTDAIAFAHVGAEVLLDGNNPYEVAGEPLGPVMDRFGVPATFVTRSLTGEPIDRLISYPAGHVLAYTGGAALGVGDMRWVTLVFQLAAIAVMWWVLLPSARSLLVLVLLIEPNLMVLFTSGGVTDWVWVLPLLITALALIKRRYGWAGLAAGVACAMKQQPWFAIPFVLVWIYNTSKRTPGTRAGESIAGFVAGIVAAFGALNLPFVLWSPSDWLQGVLAPALSDLVPDGQGLSILASRGILPIPQEVFAVLTLGFFLLGLFLYARSFERAQDLLWVLPAAVLLFSYRSFHNYFIYWLPVVLFWLCLRADDRLMVREYGQAEMPRFAWPRSSRSLVALLATLVLSGAIAALMAGGAALRVGDVSPNLSDGVLTSVDVELTNTSNDPVTPVIDIFWGGWPVPWRPEPLSTVPPGETRVIRAVPTSPDVIPALRTIGGEMMYEPFRVRANARGDSEFVSSPLIRVPIMEASIINPSLTLWGRSSHTLPPAPFGWTPVSRKGAETSLLLGPAGSGKGVALRVENGQAQEEGWAEAGLTQSVPALASCYDVLLKYTPNDSSRRTGYSTGDVGIQFIQETGSLWFVATPDSSTRVTDLPGDTRIVEVPVTPLEWQDLTLDVGDFLRGSGVEIGEPTHVKIFNSLLVSEGGPQELSISRLAECRISTS